ncbi:MAG: thioredoxin domain-containing protein [Anaerolineae bacterium]|nr:thioredoxin domain-containing protein [Anaerolineae bacterium]
MITNPNDTIHVPITTIEYEPKSRANRSLKVFGFGAVFGAVLAVVVMTITSPSNRQAPISAATLREAARQGASEALAAQATSTAAEMAQTAESVDSNQLVVQATVPAQPLVGPEPPPAEASLTLREANARGKANAPVTIVEFSDFGCYYCTTFYNNTFNRIIDKYVNSGQVKFVYKHMPITSLHPGADMAALASECAADQGKFWDYHNVLFARNADGFAKDLMIQYAKEMKLDDAKFAACLDTTEIGQRVNLDMEQAAGLGLRGTPSFLINGKQLIGAQPYEVFAQAIETALGQK